MATLTANWQDGARRLIIVIVSIWSLGAATAIAWEPGPSWRDAERDAERAWLDRKVRKDSGIGLAEWETRVRADAAKHLPKTNPTGLQTFSYTTATHKPTAMNPEYITPRGLAAVAVAVDTFWRYSVAWLEAYGSRLLLWAILLPAAAWLAMTTAGVRVAEWVLRGFQARRL